MLLRIPMVLVLTLILSACTTPQPLTPFPAPPAALMVPCERPVSIQKESGSPTASQVLSIVTANYARHHRCADLTDAWRNWATEQDKVNSR